MFLGGIPIHHNQVGTLPRLNGAEFLVELHHSGGDNRCTLNLFHRCQTRFDEQLKLPMELVASDPATMMTPAW